jgi:predicted nucleic acid-binding protein
MPGKVADASILAALIFEEGKANEAAALVSGVELHAPHLLAYELGNVTRKKILEWPEHQQQFIQALADGLSLNIRWSEVDPLGVVELALATGLTVYDAAYLHLAQSLGVPLVTFDRRLQAVAADLGPGLA